MRNNLVILFLCAFFISNSQLKNTPVVSFSFNKGTIKDEMGKVQPKGYGIKFVEDRFGNSESAVFFQGNFDSYINLGTNDLLKPQVGSISIWVKVDQQMFKGTGFHGNPIIRTRSHNGDDFNEGYALYYHFNLRKLHCNISRSESEQVTVYPSTTSYQHQWYHLVMTYDDKTLALYIDGVLEGKLTKSFKTKFLKGDSVIIGVINGLKNKRYFQGSVDDLRIYNSVLSPKEVFDLYNEPNPNKTAVIIKWVIYSMLVLVFIAIIIWVVKWRLGMALKIEKEKNQIKNHWYEQENKVLMAQMDPHFIFNSLNTIQQFIIVNDNDKAQLYLSKFSRLLRMILENNVKDRISLKEEISIITQYLEIESLRFNNVFDYRIQIAEGIDTDSVFIPRFLIQPFIENAIWHGLLPKEGNKSVTILFETVNVSALLFIIEDNGIGRTQAKKRKQLEKKESLAITFIQQRLQLMTKIYNEPYGIKIIDKFDTEGKSEGTKVVASIPILKK